MSLPRYGEYKDSGVKWLGEVPAHWDVERYKVVFREREERSLDGSETLLSVSAYTGVSPRSEIIEEGDHLTRAESLEGYKVCYPDDLVMNIMLAWNRGLGVTSYHGIVSPAYGVFEVINGANPKFLDYMMRSDQAALYYKAFSSGVIDSRLRLYPDTFGSLFCALPPDDEQTAIVAFLDRESAKIDALIAEQEKLIALLAEKRQATISHAVTKGLDPNAPMKDSGILWLGEVPAHWKSTSLSRIANDRCDGPFGSGIKSEHYTDGGALVVRLQNIRAGTFHKGESVFLDESYFLSALRGHDVVAGDLLVAGLGDENNLLGRACVAPGGLGLALVKADCFRFRLDTEQAVSQFVAWQLSAGAAYDAGVLSTGTTRSRIPLSTMASRKVLLPSVDEQEQIAAFIADKIGRIEAMRKRADFAVSLLKERRSALIAAAVTGQIDVRGLVEEQVA